MRRIAGIALCIVGLIVALVGIAFSVFGNSDNQATAVAKGGSAPYIYTAPGVLDAVDSKVKVKVTGSKNANLTVAYGASGDVAAWVKGLKATRITGLKDWKTLSTTNVNGDTKERPSLADSDMWIETKTGKGSIDIDKPYEVNKPGSIALIATSSDGKAPEISLTWQRGSDAPNMFPVILIGVLLAIVGAALIVLNMQENRQRAERLAIRERKEARRAARANAETTVLNAQDTDLAGSSRNVQTVATGSALGAGILMGSPNSDELRERSLSDQDRLVLDGPREGEEVGYYGPSEAGYGPDDYGRYGPGGDGDSGSRTQIFPVDDYSTDAQGYSAGEPGYSADQQGREGAGDYGWASGYGQGVGRDGEGFGAPGQYGQGAGSEFGTGRSYGSGYGTDYGAGNDYGQGRDFGAGQDYGSGYGRQASDYGNEGASSYQSLGQGASGYGSGYDGASYGGSARDYGSYNSGQAGSADYRSDASWKSGEGYGQGYDEAAEPGASGEPGASKQTGRAGSSSADILTGSLPSQSDGGSPIYDASESLGHYPNEAAAWEAAFGPNSPGGPATRPSVEAEQEAGKEGEQEQSGQGEDASESYLGPNNAWRTRWSFVHGPDSYGQDGYSQGGYGPQDYKATEEK